ncbi:MAG: hypothetical protein O7C59_10195, partial [Rickettsia endosymbiont of Ixodes persulcatus]|nr:hypothetical protein [Rickettsia endosymbiont of Ixodes persulcatus]
LKKRKKRKKKDIDIDILQSTTSIQWSPFMIYPAISSRITIICPPKTTNSTIIILLLPLASIYPLHL